MWNGMQRGEHGREEVERRCGGKERAMEVREGSIEYILRERELMGGMQGSCSECGI